MFGLRTWAPMASRGSTSTTVYCTANLCASRQLIVERKKKIMHGRGGGHCVRVRTSKLPAPKGMSMLASACLCSAHSSWLRVSCAPPPPPRFITSMRTTLHKNCHIILVTIVNCILFSVWGGGNTYLWNFAKQRIWQKILSCTRKCAVIFSSI